MSPRHGILEDVGRASGQGSPGPSLPEWGKEPSPRRCAAGVPVTHSGLWTGVSWLSPSTLKKLTSEYAGSCTYLTPAEIFRTRPFSPSRERCRPCSGRDERSEDASQFSPRPRQGLSRRGTGHRPCPRPAWALCSSQPLAGPAALPHTSTLLPLLDAQGSLLHLFFWPIHAVFGGPPLLASLRGAPATCPRPG